MAADLTAPEAAEFDPFSASDAAWAEVCRDPAFAEWLSEMDNDRAADEQLVAERYAAEHLERFGNSCLED